MVVQGDGGPFVHLEVGHHDPFAIGSAQPATRQEFLRRNLGNVDEGHRWSAFVWEAEAENAFNLPVYRRDVANVVPTSAPAKR
jgi:hypothetical protein